MKQAIVVGAVITPAVTSGLRFLEEHLREDGVREWWVLIGVRYAVWLAVAIWLAMRIGRFQGLVNRLSDTCEGLANQCEALEARYHKNEKQVGDIVSQLAAERLLVGIEMEAARRRFEDNDDGIYDLRR